ncbi:MAG: hypothetical protein JWN03_7145 [Nocardia sp.]|uniref:DUF6086 family protein n=1 Tax=Nocardia sp. TaxID=1821 RepID=UPI002616577F|nr:DUF6086 family protein [Nocardia sp.]MCU1646870.1 hypothetical protein [Nocardia sp.]
MSYVFEVGDETVWSPSLKVGDIYVRILKSVAEVLDRPAGLTGIASDMYEIDIDAFENLVKSMYETYFASTNTILKSMIGGVLAPSLVILERAGRKVSADSEEERHFLDWAHGLSMAQ